MIYVLTAADGSTIEVDRQNTRAPKIGASLRRNGKVYTRLPSMPSVLMPSFGLHSKPSASNQLPRYYGFREKAYNDAWAARMRRMPMDDTPMNRLAVLKAHSGPSNAEVDRRARRMAEKAKALDQFDKTGRPLAHTKRGVANHVARGRAQGDPVAWD